MKYPPFFLPVAAVLAIGLMIPTVSEARVWTSTDGKKLEAIFESLEGDMIQLKLRNGQSVKFPVSRLIADDLEACQAFCPRWRRRHDNGFSEEDRPIARS